MSDRYAIQAGAEDALKSEGGKAVAIGMQRYGERAKLSALERRVLLAQVAGSIMGGAVAGRYQQSEEDGWQGRILSQTMEIAEHVLKAAGL